MFCSNFKTLPNFVAFKVHKIDHNIMGTVKLANIRANFFVHSLTNSETEQKIRQCFHFHLIFAKISPILCPIVVISCLSFRLQNFLVGNRLPLSFTSYADTSSRPLTLLLNSSELDSITDRETQQQFTGPRTVTNTSQPICGGRK